MVGKLTFTKYIFKFICAKVYAVLHNKVTVQRIILLNPHNLYTSIDMFKYMRYCKLKSALN